MQIFIITFILFSLSVDEQLPHSLVVMPKIITFSLRYSKVTIHNARRPLVRGKLEKLTKHAKNEETMKKLRNNEEKEEKKQELEKRQKEFERGSDIA